jgi:hypothetical protein
VATENALQTGSQDPESASENTNASSRRRHGRTAIELPASQTAVLADYTTALRSAPLSDQTRRTYTSKVRQYLAWLADPLGDRPLVEVLAILQLNGQAPDLANENPRPRGVVLGHGVGVGAHTNRCSHSLRAATLENFCPRPSRRLLSVCLDNHQEV